MITKKTIYAENKSSIIIVKPNFIDNERVGKLEEVK